jgi:hypothetical protein
MKNPRWNPYLVGALIGLLSILTFSLANKPLGMSTGLAQASGACALPILGADKVAANTYWAKTAIPTWDYSTLFLVGTVLGAFLSAMLCGVFKFSADSAVWTESFGPSKTKRLIAAFLGGVIILALLHRDVRLGHPHREAALRPLPPGLTAHRDIPPCFSRSLSSPAPNSSGRPSLSASSSASCCTAAA